MSAETNSDETLPAIAALGHQFEALATREERAPQAGLRTRPRLALALAGLATLLIAASTPPGQAVGERIGELIGLVKEDGSVVIGSGLAPGEQHPFTVVVSGEPEPGETCVFVRFEELRRHAGMGSCVANWAAQDLAERGISPLVYWPPSGLLVDGSAVLQGLISAQTSRVEITYDAPGEDPASIPADLSQLDRDLLAAGGLSDDPTKFFVAFLPPEVMADAGPRSVRGVEITGYDESGRELYRRDLSKLRPHESALGHAPRR